MTPPVIEPTVVDESPVDVATMSLTLDDRGRLMMRRSPASEPIVAVARRAFPWSRPDELVSLRSKDGVELVLLATLGPPLSADARAVVLRALDAATFIPRITRVDLVDLQHGYQLWDVQTEAGPAHLRVQEREDVRFLSDTRFSVKDANGNVYEIADLAALDDHSRRELSRVI